MSLNKKEKKPRKKEDLDTETTFADMNVEGFRWYSPNKKNKPHKVGGKEFWQMVWGATIAYLPLIVIIACVGVLMYLIARLWLS